MSIARGLPRIVRKGFVEKREITENWSLFVGVTFYCRSLPSSMGRRSAAIRRTTSRDDLSVDKTAVVTPAELTESR